MIAEPHKVKSIKQLYINSYYEREVLLRESHLNVFNIRSNDVIYDMISPGSSARSQEQESGSLVGDETYAGSRNFEKLSASVQKVFGHNYVCPTHNLIGSFKLITTTMVDNWSTVPGNDIQPKYLVEEQKGRFIRLANDNDTVFTGSIDVNTLKVLMEETSSISYVYMNLFAEGFKPVSPDNIHAVQSLCNSFKIILVLNVSQSVEWASFVRKNTDYFKGKSPGEIILSVSASADVIVLDASQDPRCNIGGLIASNDYKIYEKFMNEVVVYEGLHTYGGMAGRTMESFAIGIIEMLYEPQASWIEEQVHYLADQLTSVPKYSGCDGIYIRADEFLPHIKSNQAHALAAMLYLKAGIRCVIEGKYENSTILPLQIPRLAFTNDQLFYLAKAIREVFEERNNITSFVLKNSPEWMDEAEFEWNNPVFGKFSYECEAYRIYTIEYIGVSTKEERKKIVNEVGFNTFLLASKDVSIDFLTDSGTCAQTTKQWSRYIEGDETPASSKDYFDMVDAIKDLTGYEYVIPTHQGRAAEHIMSQVLISGGYVPGNMYFTTTKLHQEMAGGTFVDVICDEAHDATSHFPWKGNIDIRKLQKIIDENGEGCIPYISFEFSVNLAGGQPVHMDNAREVYLYCKKHNIPVMFDATRAIENAYMIKKKDPRYKNSSIKEILRELFSYGDGCTVSSKKDYLVNIGGFLAIRDDEDFYTKAQSLLRIYEGSKTSGGMSAGDMAMHAQGVLEMTDINYIKARVEQTQYLGDKLRDAGIPIVEPVGTHAVFLDARRFLPHIDQENYPAQALAAALFVDSGIRAMERGNVSSGRNKRTGKNNCPKLELVRLTIPRRAYTNAHMDMVSESIINLYKNRDQIKGLEFVYEPENLRFFQGKFKEI